MILVQSIHKGKGFTLIELLVVVAIIGMLSSIVLASLNESRAKGRDSNRATQMNQFEKALELYYDRYGVYPCGDAALGSYTYDSSGSAPFLDGTGGIIPCSAPTFGLHGAGLISTPWPKDPLNDLPYMYWYTVNSARQLYVLAVPLEANAALQQNDGGMCDRMYEKGNAVGQIQPITWATPCN